MDVSVFIVFVSKTCEDGFLFYFLTSCPAFNLNLLAPFFLLCSHDSVVISIEDEICSCAYVYISNDLTVLHVCIFGYWFTTS